MVIGLDIYSHAKLAELFTLGYDGYDKEEFRLAEGGLYTEVHEQYTYNAERRSIYPQMMLNYLVKRTIWVRVRIRVAS